MTVPNEVYTMWLPILLAVLVAVRGIFRGSLRELLVSGSIVLGALICEQWSDRWAGDIHDMLGLDRGQVFFGLSALILSLVVLVVGYGLGGLVPREPLGARTRLAGGLIGLVNGAALAGWLLRYAFVGVENAQASSPLYVDPVSQGFMIWAGWFPVVVAIIAGIVALIRPLRRAQVTVARPAEATNWTPTPAPAPAPLAVSAATAYSGHAVIPTRTAVLPEADSPATSLLPRSSPTQTLLYNPQGSAPDGGDSARHTRHDDPTLPVATIGSSMSTPSWLVGQAPSEGERTVALNTVDAPPISPAPLRGTITPEQTGPAETVAAPEVASSRCPNCGAQLPANANFCTNCGHHISR